MKSYLEFINESFIFDGVKSLGKEDLSTLVHGNTSFSNEHVKGILSNKHLPEIDGMKHLIAHSGNLEREGTGFLVYHAMKEPNDTIRSHHAYHLVAHANLSDQQLNHIATRSLKNMPAANMFDDHLAKKIINKASDKEAMKASIDKLKG